MVLQQVVMIIPFRYQHPFRMNLEPYVEDEEGSVNLTASNISASAVVMFGSSTTGTTGSDEDGGGFPSRTAVILGICLGAGCYLQRYKVSPKLQSVTTHT